MRALLTLPSILVAVAALVAASDAEAAPGTAPNAPTSVRVQLTLHAKEAVWRPGSRRLELRDVGPRMGVTAIAPRREAVEVPASMLGASWRHLFGRDRGATNVLLAYDAPGGGRRRMMPLRARLVRHHAGGSHYVLAVEPLRDPGRGRGSRPGGLGPDRLVLQDVTVLVDPTITDAIRALWQALLAVFGVQDFTPPPAPVDEAGPTATTAGDGFYNGLPEGVDVTDELSWQVAQTSVLRQFEGVRGNIEQGWTFSGAGYDHLAVFRGPKYASVRFAPAAGRVELTDSSLFELRTASLEMSRADVGGMNLRGTRADAVAVDNSSWKDVDVSGTTFSRGTVSNSVLDGLVADRTVDNRDGTPDAASERGFALFDEVRFESTMLRNSSLRNAQLTWTTFEGCGLQRVDLTDALIAGPRTDPGEAFQPTFDNSMMEDVRFDGAKLSNVSFAGVDFSSGGVSLAGAVLDNVDFTGAIGLQDLDLSGVTLEGPVYGLQSEAFKLVLDDDTREYVRSMTFDGVRPGYDDETGFDVDPNGYLLDPATGVRLERLGSNLTPIDPETGTPLLTDDDYPLEYVGEHLIDIRNPEVDYEVDYGTGRLER